MVTVNSKNQPRYGTAEELEDSIGHMDRVVSIDQVSEQRVEVEFERVTQHMLQVLESEGWEIKGIEPSCVVRLKKVINKSDDKIVKNILDRNGVHYSSVDKKNYISCPDVVCVEQINIPIERDLTEDLAENGFIITQITQHDEMKLQPVD